MYIQIQSIWFIVVMGSDIFLLQFVSILALNALMHMIFEQVSSAHSEHTIISSVPVHHCDI